MQDCMKYVDEAPDDVIRTELIKTLNTVTAGKVTCMTLSYAAFILSPSRHPYPYVQKINCS